MSGPQCCSNPPTLSSRSGGGHVEELGGLKNYVSGSLDSKRAILLVSDDKGFEDAKLVLEAIKSKGISCIGAAGFCWGAKVVVELAKHDYIQAAVLLHPSVVTVEDIQAVKVPISVLGAEIDKTSPPELLKKFDSALNEKPEVDGFVKIFPGVAHGWTVRYEDGDEHAVKSAEEARNDALDWFGKYLK